MSLSERVRKAGNESQKEVLGESELRDCLRAEIQQEIPVDKLAKLAQSNPEYARNEVKSACKKIFLRPHWVHIKDEDKDKLLEKLLDSIFGFGLLEEFLADESITEIIINGPHAVFYEQAGIIHKSSKSFSDEAEVRTLIDRILGPLGRRIDEASPMVNARLPQGHRVNIVVPPIALDGPYLTIRKFSEHVITLEELCALGSIEEEVCWFMRWAILARKNIAVCGGTGSGKTTFLNALSCVIPDHERIITIEDSAELRFLTHPDVARMEARPKNAEGTGEITIRQLVINALRMRPDRIIVGECRGAEALDMLQAMNTGHDGSLTTLHANSPSESISRLTTMVRYEADLPVDVIEANIASAIHLVVQTERLLDGSRRISEIVSFSFDREVGRCRTQQIYKREHRETGKWNFVPDWLEYFAASSSSYSKELGQWKARCHLCL